MSQVVFRYIPLEELVQSSEMVLLARKAAPFESFEKIPVKGKSGKKCPPYEKHLNHFLVVEEISNPGKSLLRKRIKVRSAYFEQNVRLHEMYYRDGKMKSPIFPAYKPGLDVGNASELIIFINRVRDAGNVEFEYACWFSFESADAYAKIKGILMEQEAAD
jgi:hypothetical protein